MPLEVSDDQATAVASTSPGDVGTDDSGVDWNQLATTIAQFGSTVAVAALKPATSVVNTKVADFSALTQTAFDAKYGVGAYAAMKAAYAPTGTTSWTLSSSQIIFIVVVLAALGVAIYFLK